MRDLLRYVVTNGTGKKADVAGYDVGGKTGSAQVPGPHGRYIPHALRTSFFAAFPVHNPRYIVFVLLDQPHGTKETGGFALAGYTAAPAGGPGDRAHRAASGRAQYGAAGQAGASEVHNGATFRADDGLKTRITAMVAVKDFTGWL